LTWYTKIQCEAFLSLSKCGATSETKLSTKIDKRKSQNPTYGAFISRFDFFDFSSLLFLFSSFYFSYFIFGPKVNFEI